MKIFYILIIILFFSCNNNQPSPGQVKSVSEHDHHTMMNNKTNDYPDQVNSGHINPDTMKGSPQRVAMNTIGKTHVHIVYGSPGTKDRIIWGGVVPYGSVWVTGAHHATTIQVNHPVVIGKDTVATGQYAFFTIPGKNKWTAIFNTNTEQHLADDYDQAKDITRINIVPENNSQYVKRLTYAVNHVSETSGNITMEWEKIKITVPFITIEN